MSPTPDALDPADPLDALIASISDGRPVARPDAPAAPADDLALSALDQIARIADFNRGLQRSSSPEPTPRASLTLAVPESAVRWGDLALLECVGTGTSGEVWRAWDVRLQREVALKFPTRLAPRLGSDESPLLAEARALARLRHPGVVAVYGIAEHDGRVGMWMELLRGETLATAIEHQGRMRPAEVARIGHDLASALAAVHEAGLVHRDIKPANVILEPDGRVVLTDFGLGQPHGAGTEPGRFAGTPMFMAPELFAGNPSSPRSDLYALGVTLRWALTGKSPFKAQHLVALRDEIAGGAASPLERECPEASLALAAAIEQAMAPSPGTRFASAAELVRALADERPADGQPPKTTPAHALPAERDVFVGRAEERAELGHRFASARLVTLVGVGGMGKTRLAVRYGWKSLKTWPGGVWFCNLTDARDQNGIVAAVASALGVPLDKGDPVTQLEHVIAARGRCLLILDNFEQVAELAGATVERWLERAPEAHFLVTSRERLNLRGEHVQVLEPLAPESGVELFVERARRQFPEFGLQAAETDAVLEVVRLTEGMPLAIELAAARIRMMTVGQVAERMRERFRLLGSAGTGRHASLRAVIEGSWDTLTDWEKAAFAQCAVFEGGFTLAAAEGVLDLSAWPDAPWVVDVVQALVDKSLLRVWVPEAPPGDGAPDARFGMYVTLHEYARQKLGDEQAIGGGASGQAAVRAAEERHGAWYAGLGSDVDTSRAIRLYGTEARRVREDLENLITASRRALDRGDAETALATYHCAAAVLILRGPMGAALDMGHRLTQSPHVNPRGRAEVLFWIGQAEWFAGHMNEARSYFEAALTIHREIRDRAGEASDLDCLGSVYRAQGRTEDAIASHEAALAVCRAIGERRQEGVALGNLGIVHRALGHHEIARSFYEASLRIHREVGNRSSEGVVLSNLGNLLRAEGRLEEARVQHEAALALHRLVGNRRSEGHVLGSLGNVYTDLGRLAEARAHFQSALAIHREFGDRRFEGVVLGYLGTLHSQLEKWEEAAKYYQAALAIAREVGSRHFECGVLGELANLERDQGRMETARQLYASALAMAAELGDQIAEGAILACRANLHRQCGQTDLADHDLGRGESILRDLNAKLGLGKLLCERAELEQMRGNAARATAALAEAEGLAVEITPPSWEFARMLDHARASLGQEA